MIKCISQLILNIESFAEAAGCAVKVFDLIEQVNDLFLIENDSMYVNRILGNGYRCFQ